MIGLYFSGTGNSRFAAQEFLKVYDPLAELYAIEHNIDLTVLDQDEIVLAYPIYYSSLPKILNDYIDQHAAFWKGKKIFLICTMGLFSGDGCGCAARKLKKYGASIIGGLHLVMPDCITDVKALKKQYAENLHLLQLAQKKAQEGAMLCKQGRPPQQGLSLAAHICGLFGQRLWFGRKTKTYRKQIQIAQTSCTHCGLCTQVCPMQNLYMHEQKVVQKGACTMCYRCVNTCPQQAITILGKQVRCAYQCQCYEDALQNKT